MRLLERLLFAVLLLIKMLLQDAKVANYFEEAKSVIVPEEIIILAGDITSHALTHQLSLATATTVASCSFPHRYEDAQSAQVGAFGPAQASVTSDATAKTEPTVFAITVGFNGYIAREVAFIDTRAGQVAVERKITAKFPKMHWVKAADDAASKSGGKVTFFRDDMRILTKRSARTPTA